jgi:hypothetical protein
LTQRLDGGETRLARIAPVRDNPVDLGRSRVGSHFDAAMPLFNCRVLADEFFCRSGTEVVCNLGFERWLVAFEGQQVIGLVLNNLIGDGDLTAHGTRWSPALL